MKNPLTPSGIEPATSRFVAQHLNHCATAVTTDAATSAKFNDSTCIFSVEEPKSSPYLITV